MQVCLRAVRGFVHVHVAGAEPVQPSWPELSSCGASLAMVWAKHQPDAGVALKPP